MFVARIILNLLRVDGAAHGRGGRLFLAVTVEYESPRSGSRVAEVLFHDAAGRKTSHVRATHSPYTGDAYPGQHLADATALDLLACNIATRSYLDERLGEHPIVLRSEVKRRLRQARWLLSQW